jgi:hypothetical protein
MPAPLTSSHTALARAALSLLLVVAGCRFKVDRDVGAGEIRGRVMVDSAGGNYAPAEGASVKLIGSTRQLRTDAQGKFQLRPLGAGEYALTLTHTPAGKTLPEAVLGLKNLKLEPAGGLELGNLRLAVAGSIAGRVLLDGIPVPNAALTVLDADGQPMTGIPVARSDGNGRYVVPFAVAGAASVQALFEWTVDTQRKVLTAKSQPVAIAPRTQTQVDLALTAPREAEMGSVQGAATYQEDVGNVTATLTDDEGNTYSEDNQSPDLFLINNVPAGIYTLTLTANDLEPVVLEDVVVDGPTEVGTLTFSQRHGQPFDCNGDGVIACFSASAASCDHDDDGDGYDDSTEDPGCRCRPGAVKDAVSGLCVAPNPCGATGAQCGTNATCSAHAGRALCTCDMGFKGDGVDCVRAANCADDNGGCDAAHGLCSEENGQISCECAPGFIGDGKTCEDVDECQDSSTCGTFSTCTNAVGSYTCGCLEGFTPLEGQVGCTDIDECFAETATCPLNSTCSNDPGAYSCPCDQGYEADAGSCVNIDECTRETDLCDLNATCADNDGWYTCTCVDGFSGDGISCTDNPPVISQFSISPSVLGPSAGVEVTVTFEVSERISNADMIVSISGTPATCVETSTAPFTYSCSYTTTGTEVPTGTQSAQEVKITLWDGVNTVTGTESVVFDFRPPQYTAKVIYTPAEGNVLSTPTLATSGTKVTLELTADEDFDPQQAPTIVVTGVNSTVQLPFEAGTASGDPRTVAFEYWVSSEDLEDAYGVVVTSGDLLGNVGPSDLGAIVGIQLYAPELTVDQTKLLFLRSPNGSSTPTKIGGLDVPAGSFAAVLSPSYGAISAETFTLGTKAPRLVRVTTGWRPPQVLTEVSPADMGHPTVSGVIATLSPETDATWALSWLPAGAAWETRLYVTGIDDAGNESMPVMIEQAEWVGTTNIVENNWSDGRWYTTVDAQRSLVQDPRWETSIYNNYESTPWATGPGLEPQIARAQPVWKERTGEMNSPWLSRVSMAWDAARGKLVLHSGGTSGGDASETWEWSDNKWSSINYWWPPQSRRGHSTVYDAARNRVMVYGGFSDGVYLGDLWEWDGSSWQQQYVWGDAPAGRTQHAMAYDSARRVLVVFGGTNDSGDLDDTWEWNGSAWTNVTPASDSPAPRHAHAMAYDSDRRRVVLFGGTSAQTSDLNDIWEWDGTTWAQVATLPAGLARSEHGMVYDAARKVTLVYGGVQAGANGVTLLNDLLSWDGSNWKNVSISGNTPPLRRGAGVAYDTVAQRTLVFGGGDLQFDEWEQSWNEWESNSLWAWDGTEWTDLTITESMPSDVEFPSMVYDPVRGTTVMYGGGSAGDGIYATYDTWEWNGIKWVRPEIQGNSPNARYKAAAAFDGSRGQMVVLGGIGNSGYSTSDFSSFDGKEWTALSSGGAAEDRWGAGLVYDSLRSVLVLFGGSFANGTLNDTWEWNGTGWSNVSASASPVIPEGLEGFSMAYMPSTVNRTVVYGGFDASGTYSPNFWTWDGSDWKAVGIPDDANGGPSARANPMMAYDSARQRLVVFGGEHGQSYLDDLWEWDGKDLVARDLPVGPKPSGRGRSGFAYDAKREKFVLYGGYEAEMRQLYDTWELDVSNRQVPAIYYEVSLPSGAYASQISSVGVDGYCGGVAPALGSAGDGAVLTAWSTGDAAHAPGWVELARTTEPLGSGRPALSPSAAPLSWTAPDLETTKAFLQERDGRLTFACRARGGSTVEKPAAVGMSHLSVRLRYAVQNIIEERVQ